jgi:hypothetical protein
MFSRRTGQCNRLGGHLQQELFLVIQVTVFFSDIRYICYLFVESGANLWLETEKRYYEPV